MAWLLRLLAAGGLTDDLVVLRKFRRGTNHLPDVEIGRLQLESQFVEGHPGLRVHLRIVDGHAQLEMIAVRAVETLLDDEIAAMRAAGPIDPSPFIDTRGLHHEGVVIDPFSD